MIISFRCFSIKESKAVLELIQHVYCILIFFRSSHQRCSVKKAVHKNFAIFTRKHLCWSFFLMKLQAYRKQRLQHRCFPVINTKFLRTPLLKDICKQLLMKFYLVLLLQFLEDIQEVAVCRHFTKQVFLKHLQNSQESTYARVSSIKLQTNNVQLSIKLEFY